MKRSMENADKKEYIEREALIKGFTSDGCRFVYGNSTVKAIVSRIMATPTADVAPVVHGKWIPVSDDDQYEGEYYCSVCSAPMYSPECVPQDEYCYHCGADMRKKVE